jgi:quercetin dioxygenase-like cupin family protein
MKYLHLFEDEAGVSHFEEKSIDLASDQFAPPAPPLLLSAGEAATRCFFLTLPAGWGGALHRSPKRQIAFCLAGRMRVEAGDGDVRETSPGGIWRMEDTTGAGHTTTVVGDDDVQLAVVQLE